MTALPVGPGVDRFARKNGLSTEQLVLEGGEEYAIVGTIKRARLPLAKTAVRRAGGELIEIGRATSRKVEVKLRVKGLNRQIRDEGWTHLR